MKIRLAIPEDVQAILPLFKSLDEKHSRNSSDIRDEIKLERYTFLFDNTFKENSNLILSVAEENMIVIGFALAKMTRVQNNFILKDSRIGEVLYVAVEEEYKKKGIGKQLMIDMENRLRENGVNKFELRVFSFNDETFPEKVNYKPKYTVYEKYI
jgi:N-acetylglutamate synthase-like GNAT family acetyltransferase